MHTLVRKTTREPTLADKISARQRLANLMATCVARKLGHAFSYWPKLDPEYLRYMGAP